MNSFEQYLLILKWQFENLLENPFRVPLRLPIHDLYNELMKKVIHLQSLV